MLPGAIMEIIETSVFTKQVTEVLSDEEYHVIQIALVQRPGLGARIPGTSGLRKLRWRSEGKGKCGGMRIIYYWFISEHEILMLYLYKKNRQADLTAEHVKILTTIVEKELK
jgi:hypothetical protein